MSIFKEIDKTLRNKKVKIKKTYKSTPRLQKNKNGKVLYLIVRDPEIINENGNPTHITLVKLPITELREPKNVHDLINRFGTDAAKSGKYSITNENVAELRKAFQCANKLYKDHIKDSLHDKQTVEIDSREHQVCKIAAKIHDAVALFDELEATDEVGVIEAQEIHQAIYRLKNRLNAIRLPDQLFNDLVFQEPHVFKEMRDSYPFNTYSEKNYSRVAEHYEQLTPLNLKLAEKKSEKATHAREAVAQFVESKVKLPRK